MQSLEPKQQARFLDLRRQLTDLNYGGNFDVSAMGLAEHLLGAITRTSGAYQELQDKEARLASDLSLAQAQLFPLRKDNSRLTRENHQLHVDNIRQTDAAANMFAEQNVSIRKLQDELAELHLVVKLKEDQRQRSEIEMGRMKDAYEELADPTMKASKGTKRMIKMSSALPPKSSTSDSSVAFEGGAGSAGSTTDSEVIEALRRQLDEAHSALRHANAEMSRLQAAVSAREMELARSTRASDLEDAGSTKAEQLANADASNKRIIDQLNGQVDFLNEQLALREAQLVESANKVIRAEQIQLEAQTNSNLVETLRTQNSDLSSQLRQTERKVTELTEALDPEGSVSVDELFDESSSHSVKNMMNLLHAGSESKTDVNRSADSAGSGSSSSRPGRGNSSVPMPEQTRSSRGDMPSLDTTGPSTGRRPPKTSSTSFSSSLGGEESFSTAKALASSEAKLIAAQRKISISAGPASVKVDSVLTKREHEAIVARLVAEKTGLVEDVRNLTAKLDETSRGDTLLKERMRKGEERLASVKSELEETLEQAETLARQVQQKDQYLNIRETECAELQRKLSETSAKLGSSSHVFTEMEWKTNHTQAQLEEACRERDTAQTLSERLRGEISLLRRERIDVISAKDEAEGRARILERDYQGAQAAADKANRQVLESKEDGVKLSVKVDTLNAQNEAFSRKLEHAERMLSQTQANLNTNKAELTEALNSLAMYQMSTAPGNVADQLRADLKALKQRCLALESANDSLQSEKADLLEKNHTLTSRSFLGTQAEQQSNEDKTALLADLDIKNDKILALQKSSQILELEVDRLAAKLKGEEQTVASLRASARDREAQSHSTLNTSQQLTSDVTMLTRRCIDAEDAYATIRRQSEKDQQALVRLGERCNSAEREVASLSDLLVSSQQELEGVQIQLVGAKKQLEGANRQLAMERADTNTAVHHQDEMEKRVNDLKTLLSNNESAVRSQALKNAQLLNTIHQGEDHTKRLDLEISRLRSTLSDKDDKIESLMDALKNLDGGRDEVQNQLDEEQERVVRLDGAMQQLEQKNLHLRQVVEQSFSKLKATNKELVLLQQNNKNLDERLAGLKEENSELKRRYSMKNSDVAGAAEDLMLMTKENQALTSELADTSMERDRLRGRVTEVIQKMASLEQSRRALEVERTDLLDTYRSVLSEKRKLEHELNALGQTKQRTGVSVQNMQGSIAELKGLVNSHSVTEKRWAMERSSQLKQLETLNDELVRCRTSVEAVEADNRRLMQDTHALRQTNTMLNERVQMVIKRATAAADANKVLSSRLSSVERERDAVRALVNAERQRAEDYGSIAETARAQIASREVELQRLRGGDFISSSGGGGGVGASLRAEVRSVSSVADSGKVSSSLRSSNSHSNTSSGGSSAAAAAAAAALNSTLGLSEDDSINTPPTVSKD